MSLEELREKLREIGFGNKLKEARLAAKKTQDQVADELEITKGAVSQWEGDNTVPELEYFMAFCLFTEASADEILLQRKMDPLLKQLVEIWERLSLDGRDTLLGNANRILTEEKPEPGPHNPFGSPPVKSGRSKNNTKDLKKGRSP